MADMVEKHNMNLKDKFTFSSAPLHLTDKWQKAKKCFKDFAFEYR
jgi:hypothetical protein